MKTAKSIILQNEIDPKIGLLLIKTIILIIV